MIGGIAALNRVRWAQPPANGFDPSRVNIVHSVTRMGDCVWQHPWHAAKTSPLEILRKRLRIQLFARGVLGESSPVERAAGLEDFLLHKLTDQLVAHINHGGGRRAEHFFR